MLRIMKRACAFIIFAALVIFGFTNVAANAEDGYTNPEGVLGLNPDCTMNVLASNTPSPENPEGLQPANFVVKQGETELKSFQIASGQQEYDIAVPKAGTVILFADGVELDRTEYPQTCFDPAPDDDDEQVTPPQPEVVTEGPNFNPENQETGGPAVPSVGA